MPNLRRKEEGTYGMKRLDRLSLFFYNILLVAGYSLNVLCVEENCCGCSTCCHDENLDVLDDDDDDSSRTGIRRLGPRLARR